MLWFWLTTPEVRFSSINEAVNTLKPASYHMLMEACSMCQVDTRAGWKLCDFSSIFKATESHTAPIVNLALWLLYVNNLLT